MSLRGTTAAGTEGAPTADPATPTTAARVAHLVCALVLCAVVLGGYLPTARVIGLERGSLGIQGMWIGGHAKQVTTVTSGGPADRAGLRPGDVLEFDPERDADWVLVGYRHMPEGFRATLPLRRADGTRTIVELAPDRVTYLPSLNDKAALLARLGGLLVMTLIGLFMVWMRPGLMTWSLLLAFMGGFPTRIFADYYLGFLAGPGTHLLYYLPPVTMSFGLAFLPFAMSFPHGTLSAWPRWKLVAALLASGAWLVFLLDQQYIHTFDGPLYPTVPYTAWVLAGIGVLLGSIAALARTYRRSDGMSRARLRWALLGMAAVLGNLVIFLVFLSFSFVTGDAANASQLTPGNWLFAISAGILFPLSFGYAVLRERVVDVQFAVSRTLVYGVVSTIVVVFLAVLHWLLGRMIEHSRLAFGLEGLVAVGLGYVLHRATHRINVTVDRVLFRKHHRAEERLRQVTAALPFASSEMVIAEGVVREPVRNLELASAALFYRNAGEGPLRRVLAEGWGDEHATTLDEDDFLVRYLQAEHTALRLEDDQKWLPERMPVGAARPVLAIPIVTQHVLTAVVLYGAHVNSTLPDPDEVELLEALAKAAATSHQQVRIAVLLRENEAQKRIIAQLEQSSAELRAMLGARLAGEGGGR